jgi:hypothetical protein
MGDSENPREFRPHKVVVQPWLGRHHVYGIFIVPKLYGDESKYRATMGMRGWDDKFVVEEGGEELHDDEVVIEQGYYPKQIYLPTRLLLWKLFVGQFGIAQDRCNWILEFIERPPLP